MGRQSHAGSALEVTPDAPRAVVPHALVVEDDADSAEMLAELVKAEGFATAIATNLVEARQQLAFREPDVVLLDLLLPDGNGMELFEDLQRLERSDIVLVTGHASLETSIQALRLGVADYLTKPINVRQLKSVLARLSPPGEMRLRIASHERDLGEVGRYGRLWGRSAPMRNVYQQIGRVAGTAVNVLVTGESGTGKELVAQTIHELSRRRDEPFLAVNCGAISPQLIESEMFGHEKGSFTGAARQHLGYFERANGGTLLLDEITEMPPDLQVKLLRVLETGMLTRIGGDAPIATDVRIVAATNRDPGEAVVAGKLREDLFYRLNVFRIHLPALRERVEDIAQLAEHFLAALNEREQQSKHLTPGAVEALARSHWPGNVRQLRNAVERAFIMAEGGAIDEHSLSLDAPRNGDEASAGPAITVRIGSRIADVERRLILETLEHCDGRKEKAAELLGISGKTLYNRLRQYQRQTGGGDD